VDAIQEIRDQLQRDYFPRIADLRNEVHVTLWSDHHLISQPLFDILPFGRALSPESFYQYHDYQFPELVILCRRNLLYWVLTRARHFTGDPATSITLFFDDTFLWHYYVPARQEEIKSALRNGDRIRFLSRFHLSQAEIQVEFSEFRLLSATNQIAYADSKEYVYTWATSSWRITILDTGPTVDPQRFTIPPTEPNTLGRDYEYEQKLAQILNQPNDLRIDAQYWNSVDSSPAGTSRNRTPPPGLADVEVILT
jgi:hypothetical protein